MKKSEVIKKKQKEAAQRKASRDKRTDEDQLKKLDAGQRAAGRERARLQQRIDRRKRSEDTTRHSKRN